MIVSPLILPFCSPQHKKLDDINIDKVKGAHLPKMKTASKWISLIHGDPVRFT